MVLTYYIKLFQMGADRHNGILMSLLLLVAETKNVNMSLLNIMICYHFSLELSCKDTVKNNPTEKQIDAEIQATLKHEPA